MIDDHSIPAKPIRSYAVEPFSTEDFTGPFVRFCNNERKGCKLDHRIVCYLEG